VDTLEYFITQTKQKFNGQNLMLGAIGLGYRLRWKCVGGLV
jgi:hypothetical protein